jgi:membrane-associated phospholipid phosphatase
MNLLLEVFNFIGQNGPYILLIILTIMILNYKSVTLYGIIFIMCAINSQINYVLKGFFKEPRPNVNQFKAPKLSNHSYGMPSGHSQSSSFFASMIVKLFKSGIPYLNLIKFGSVLLVIITGLQRIFYKFHTIKQVLAGWSIGTFNAWLGLNLLSKYMIV